MEPEPLKSWKDVEVSESFHKGIYLHTYEEQLKLSGIKVHSEWFEYNYDPIIRLYAMYL